MRSIFSSALILCLASSSSSSQDQRDTLGPIRDYLLDETFEIALATSAGPEHVGSNAKVLVLRSDGYHSVRAGTNGFTCLVERSWSSPLRPERPSIDFWNPRLRAPICYNEEGAATILGEYLRRTELALAGKSRKEMKRAIDADLAEGRLRAPRQLAMSYMLSAGQFLGTQVGRYKPHVMFYVPYSESAHLGSNSPNSDHPVMFEHEGGPFAAIVVPVPHFNEIP